MNRHQDRQRGFTLFELMIVLAIVSIVTGFALPSLTRHVAKTQISRVHTELSHYRNPIEQLIQSGNQPELAADAKSALDFVDSDLSSVVFGSFANAASSTITATLDESASSFIHGTTVTLWRDGNGTWTCIVVGAGGGWSDKLKPSFCS